MICHQNIGQHHLKRQSAVSSYDRAMLPDVWLTCPPSLPPLGSDAHVCWIEVSRWRSRVFRLRQLLASDERARADRFRFAADADRYVIGRSVLRVLISDVVGMAPERIVFTYSANGKPSVPGLEFNLAHSGDAIVIAIHRSPIGIDLERIDRAVDVAGLGRVCLTAREREVMQPLPLSPEAFFRLWTRKEAWLKAVGAGLSFPLRDVDVSDAAAPTTAPGVVGEGAQPSRIIDLPAGPGYMAACALCDGDAQVRLWHMEKGLRV